ncbi:hypothetical protein P8605_44595 [Streptomyces sp. T-3]|nr:hypothetical protein [Streptomyces sp. T-3]
MISPRKVLGAATSAALVVLAAPAVAQADDAPKSLANATVPALAEVKNPVGGQDEALKSLPQAMEMLLGKLATQRDDRVKQDVFGG